MVAYNFKNIRTVPPGKEIIDIVLSKTQRQTPTVVHAGYSMQRIRAFYMRKVKYTCETVADRMDRILQDFPKLDDIHPFYSDLCNVLYDRDHYKLALGQLNIAKHLIANVSRDYVRMLKYGDSLYRCKQLKRAALGRMCTILKKQSATLSYLEEVRKHLGRLPSIDPNSRTLLITGFPNVGKSSFMNSVTHADVDVQPYAFTTKSLFVGHMDYKYLRWQVIDSPGVLDKPLEERNTIEMLAITALAHLQCVVLYFFDVSEQCGWNLEAQAALFLSLKPLFVNKPLVIVANKVDVMPLAEMDVEKREMIERIAREAGAPLLPMSAMNAIGVTNVKRTACEALLERRVEQKSKKIGTVLNKLTVTLPAGRDQVPREHSIPTSVLEQRALLKTAEVSARKDFKTTKASAYEDKVDAEEAEELAALQAKRQILIDQSRSRKTARDIQEENGGAGVYSVNLREHYRLFNQEWVGDAIPEIMDGKNIADFVDADIEARLAELEREEEEAEQRAQEQMDLEDEGSELDEEELETVTQIRKARGLAKKETEMGKKKNAKRMPRATVGIRATNAEIRAGLEKSGYDTSLVHAGAKRARADTVEDKDAEEPADFKTRSLKRGRHDPNPGDQDEDPRRGVRTGEMYMNATQKKDALKRFQKARSVFRVQGQLSEGDRFTTPKLLKHMLVGKRGGGKTDRR